MKRLTNQDIDERLNGRSIVRRGNVVNISTPIEWECIACSHVWLNTPDRVIGTKQIGCPNCSNRKRLTNELVDSKLPSTITRMSNVEGTHKTATWKCGVCTKVWNASPNNVLNKKSGCPDCNNASLTNDKVDERLIGRNIERRADVVNTHTRITWVCTVCANEWSTSPASILNEGSGCPRCARLVSKGELSWLSHCGVPDDAQHRQVILNVEGKRFKVDGYDPVTNTVYEYWGDYWHGNPAMYDSNKKHPIVKATYGELYRKTEEKRRLLVSAGYTLVEMWDSDWRKLTSTRK